MKLRVLPDAKFSCGSCSNCCRHWHVELSADDVGRIEALAWPVGDPLAGASPFFRHGGRTFLAHRADGDCVYLNAANGLCRIHEQFGAEAKPLGCRLYPFQIVPTFDNEVTVTARFDCPTVRRNDGAPHGDAVRELTRYAGQMRLPEPFDERTRSSFGREQIEAACEFAGTLMSAFPANDRRALFLALLCDWLQERLAGGAGDFDRSDLAKAFAELKARVEAAASEAPSRLGLIGRVAFRTLLGMYLRRDEDVLNGQAGRVRRLLAMISFVLGIGSFKALGVTHPPGSLRAARRFSPGPAARDPNFFELHWRMIRTKLESLQFMGAANRGHDFLSGLRSLAMLYPLVLAAAKYRAAGRSAPLDSTDIDYGVAAIEHSFGRSAILAQPLVRTLETFLLRREQFIRLLSDITGERV